MTVVLLSFASVALVSLVSLIGLLTISTDERRVRRLAELFVCFAVGALLGDAFIHLLPEAFAKGGSGEPALGKSLLVLGGMMVFFVVEKLLRHTHVLHAHEGKHELRRPEVAAINVLGDAIHNFIDGVLIGASYLANPVLGVSTTVAVLLHEIPQELGDFGILLNSGLGVRKAVLLNLASASVAIVGTAVALVAGMAAQEAVISALLPVTAGGFVYLAAADLIPELQHDRSVRAPRGADDAHLDGDRGHGASRPCRVSATSVGRRCGLFRLITATRSNVATDRVGPSGRADRRSEWSTL
jgi:zinc and cadmium transporter